MPAVVLTHLRLPPATRAALDRLGGPGGRFPSRRAAVEAAIQTLILRAAAGQPLPAAPAPEGPERVSFYLEIPPALHYRLVKLVQAGHYPTVGVAVVAALTLLDDASEGAGKGESPAAD